ncbi:ERF family protein [Methanosphaera sp.]|jgi:hypothetical protein|uniref:ERF family protein n=1 Tax=Methanosphaera sp. TaxID=2666342 RepID=UPI003D89B735
MAVITMGDEKITKNQDVLDKIQQGKFLLSQTQLNKSGRNNFQKYNYFELKDFLPAVEEICVKLGLRTHLNMKSQRKVKLEVSDKESGTSTEFVIHRPINNEKNPSKYIQLEGSIQTYCMRYLYIQMFELTESDAIDAEDQSKTQQPQKATTKHTQKKPVKKQELKPAKKQTNKKPAKPETPQKPKEYKYKTVEEVSKYIKEFYEQYKIQLTVERGKNTIQNMYDKGEISEEVMFDAKDMLIKTLI